MKKLNIVSTAVVFFCLILSTPAYSARAIKWGPSLSRPSAQIEDGFNFTLAAGAVYGLGHDRDWPILSAPHPWEKEHLFAPDLTLGFEYAFLERFAVQIKVPLSIIGSGVDFFAQIEKHFGLGAEFISLLPSLYGVLSLYPSETTAISWTPRFIFPFYGNVNGHINDMKVSRVLIDNQIALSFHLESFDIGPYVDYTYAPGNGFDLLWTGIFSDTVVNHMISAGAYMKF